MRTTLTIDDDLASILQKRASERGHSFKEVVNRVLRAGIVASGEEPARSTPIQVIARPLGLRPGFDPDKLNPLVDELEVEAFLRKTQKDDPARH